MYTVIYCVLFFGRVTVSLRANLVIATPSFSPETFRVIEKAFYVQPVPLKHEQLALHCFFVFFLYHILARKKNLLSCAYFFLTLSPL